MRCLFIFSEVVNTPGLCSLFFSGLGPPNAARIKVIHSYIPPLSHPVITMCAPDTVNNSVEQIGCVVIGSEDCTLQVSLRKIKKKNHIQLNIHSNRKQELTVQSVIAALCCYLVCELIEWMVNMSYVHAGLPDPFAKVVVDGSGQCHSTDTVKSTLDPKWNQHYDLWVSYTTPTPSVLCTANSFLRIQIQLETFCLFYFTTETNVLIK